MALAPHCLGHGSCMPAHPFGPGQVIVSTRMRIVMTCSSNIIHNEETLQSEDSSRVSSSKNGSGNEGSDGEQHKTLREQLRLLNLNSMSKRGSGARSVNVETPVKSNSRSARPSKGGGSGTVMNSVVVGRVLEILKTANESEEGVALAMKQFEGSFDPYDVVAILNSLKSWRLALLLFRWLRAEHSSSLNIYTYNVMLKVLRRGRQWEFSQQIAEDMANADVRPDNITYSTLISCANRCNYQDAAMAWFDRMHEAGCVPDVVTYSTMIDVYGKMGKYDEAIALYERVKQAGWKPDKVTYGTMVRLFGRAGYIRAAVSIFEEMKGSGVQPDAIVYNIMIACLGRAGRMGHALKVFEEMEREGVKPNAVTLSTVMETYSRCGNVMEGLEVFQRLRQGVACDVIVYNAVLKMCREAGLASEAEQYLREMTESGHQPNDWTYRNMISVYAKKGMAVEAHRTFSQMVEAGYQIDVMAYTSLLQAYGNAKEYNKVQEILDEMTSVNCAPDERLCCVILNLLDSCDTDEELGILRSCLRMCSSTMDTIVGQIFEENLVLRELRGELQSLLSDITEEAHKPICNSLMQLSWHKGDRNHSFQLLSLFRVLGVYTGLQTKSPTMWSLHLRSLSTGAAHCALLSWLSSVRYAIKEGQELPGRIIIETGVGNQLNADEFRLIVVISSLLKECSSPFKECADRKDWLEASGVDVTQWLESTSLDLPTVNTN